MGRRISRRRHFLYPVGLFDHHLVAYRGREFRAHFPPRFLGAACPKIVTGTPRDPRCSFNFCAPGQLRGRSCKPAQRFAPHTVVRQQLASVFRDQCSEPHMVARRRRTVVSPLADRSVSGRATARATPDTRHSTRRNAMPRVSHRCFVRAHVVALRPRRTNLGPTRAPMAARNNFWWVRSSRSRSIGSR